MIYMKEKRSMIKKINIISYWVSFPIKATSEPQNTDWPPKSRVSFNCFQPTQQLVLNMAQPANYKFTVASVYRNAK